MQSARNDRRGLEHLSGPLAVIAAAVVVMVLVALASTLDPEAVLQPAILLPAAAINIGIVAALGWGLSYYRGLVADAEQLMREERRARGEAVRQRDSSATIIDSDSTAVVLVEPGRPPELAGRGTVRGAPPEVDHLMDWASWLTPPHAQSVAFQVQQLLSHGRAFTAGVTTLTGVPLEIDGRASAAGAVLRLRDLSTQQGDTTELKRQTERWQRESNQWRTLADAMPLPVWLRSADGKLEWVNAAYVKAVDGLSREDVRLRQVEWLDQQQRAALEASASAERVQRQRFLVKQGNERRALDVTVAGQSGEVDRAPAGFALDVSKQLDSQALASAGGTLDKVSTAIAIFGPEGRLDFCNRALLSLWRLEAEWLKARPRLGDLLDRLRETRQLPEVIDYRAWKQRQLRSAMEPAEVKESWHLPTGQTVDVRTVPRPDGGVTCFFDDVTERLVLESRLNALLNVQGETLDHLKEGVAVFGTDGRLRLYNSAFARIWRLDPALLAQEPHVEEVLRRCRISYEHEETWLRINRAVTGIVDRRQAFEGQMIRPDESVIDYAVLPLPDGAELLTFVDVTDSKRAERMLTERNEALEAADKLKDQFVSSVSYEMRVPLQSIIGFSDLLSSPVFGPLNAKQREYVEDIAASSKTLLAIINDILDLATIDAGSFDLKLAPVDVTEIVHAAAAGVSDRVDRARLDLLIDIDPAVTSIVADGHRLKQVLFNLLANATGFSEPGGRIALVARRHGAMIVFEVEDEGAGIPHELQGQVFERFVSNSQGSRHRGAGLGLAMVKSLVELHGGSVGLESEPGQGTRVTVRLPERPANGTMPMTHRMSAAAQRKRAAG